MSNYKALKYMRQKLIELKYVDISKIINQRFDHSSLKTKKQNRTSKYKIDKDIED